MEDKMFKPRIPPTDKVDEDEIKKRISSLKTEISTLKNSENFGNTFSFDDVVEILEKENDSLLKLIHYEETRTKSRLEKEKSTLLRKKVQEEYLISSCSGYLKNESFVRGEAVDSAQEMLLKLEVLHKKLCTLLKKFAHHNFPVLENESVIKSSKSKTISTSDKPKKSVYHILKLLLPELSSMGSFNLETQILKIDETMSPEIIQFLLNADIIEKCPGNADYIKLHD